jgi:hypothetical protein
MLKQYLRIISKDRYFILFLVEFHLGTEEYDDLPNFEGSFPDRRI